MLVLTGDNMSFVINFFENDTIKYWKKKLKGKWYKLPFLMSKNLEIDSFLEEYTKPPLFEYGGEKVFKLSTKRNNIIPSSKVAIVVPVFVRNDKGKKQVEALIQSIKKQNIEPDFVFLVDDCSPSKYQTYGLNVTKMDTNGGPAKARNKGIELAVKNGADIIAFTDSDVILTEDWVGNIKKFFIENKQYQALSGKTVSYGNTWYDLYHDVNGTLNGRKFKELDQLLYGPTCNFAIDIKALDNLRFSVDFPLAAGEDIDFCFQFLKKRNNIGYANNVKIYHDFGFEKWRYFTNKNSFKNVFKKYAKGEKVLLKRIPEYYYFLNETREISNRV